MWLRSTWLGVTDTSTTPSANRLVKTTPIAASSLTRVVSRTSPISATDPIAEHQRADRERQPDEVGQHDAGQHGVGDGVAEQRPADEHEPAREQRAHDRGDERDEQGALHELVLPGRGEPGQGRGHRGTSDVGRCAGAVVVGARRRAGVQAEQAAAGGGGAGRRRAAAGEHPGAEQHDLVGERRQRLQVVRGDQHRAPLGDQPAQQCGDGPPRTAGRRRRTARRAAGRAPPGPGTGRRTTRLRWPPESCAHLAVRERGQVDPLEGDVDGGRRRTRRVRRSGPIRP